jgi:hypothetical protein
VACELESLNDIRSAATCRRKLDAAMGSKSKRQTKRARDTSLKHKGHVVHNALDDTTELLSADLRDKCAFCLPSLSAILHHKQTLTLQPPVPCMRTLLVL